MRNRMIQAVQVPCDQHGNPLDYVVGRQGVTAIKQTERNGEYCTIPYVEIWAGNDLLAVMCQHKLSFIQYTVPNCEEPEDETPF